MNLTRSSSQPEDRPNPYWFLHDRNTCVYFLRELTGLGLAFYATYFVIAWFLDPQMNFLATPFFLFASAIGWVCSVFHSITWFAVSLHVTPVDLPPWIEALGFWVLLFLCAVVSYFLFLFLYV